MKGRGREVKIVKADQGTVLETKQEGRVKKTEEEKTSEVIFSNRGYERDIDGR